MKCYCDDDTCHYIKSQDEKCHQDCLGGEEADGQREVEAEVVVGQDDHLLDGDDYEAHQDHHQDDYLLQKVMIMISPQQEGFPKVS